MLENLSVQGVLKLFSLLPHNVYIKNRKGEIMWCNDNMAKVILATVPKGNNIHSAKDLIGKTDFDFLAHDLAQKVKLIDERVMDFQEPYEAEEIGLNVCGKKVVYSTRKVSLCNESGEVIGLLGISVNISEKDVNIISLLPGNVYWKNREGVFLMCNQNVASILGFNAPENIIGKTNFDLFDHALAEKTTDIDNAIMKNNEEFRGEEHGFNSSGESATYFTLKKPLHDPSGKVKGLLGISMDITEQVKTRKALERARKKNAKIQQDKFNCLANLANYLETPFYKMLTLIQHLEINQKSRKAQNDFKNLLKISGDFIDKFRRIVLFTKMHNDENIPLQREPLNLQALITETFLESAKLKNELNPALEFTLDYDHRLNKFDLIGDGSKIQFIVSELLDNAIRFTPKGFVRLTVKKIENQKEKLIIKIAIEDSGSGIAQSMRRKVFKPFTSEKLDRVGLGLSIVNTFTQSLSAELKFESQSRQGTIFNLFLTLQKDKINPKNIRLEQLLSSSYL